MPLMTAADCLHCSLPVPSDREQFCCEGCRTVYQVLHQEGMKELYEKTRQSALPARTYEVFDDPTFLRLHSRAVPGGQAIDLYLEGVHCAACIWLLEKLPRMVPGVLESRLHFSRSMLSLTWNPSKVTLESIASFVDRLGYRAHAYRDLDRQSLQRAEDRRMLIRIGVAGAVAGNVMGIAFALYGGATNPLFRWLSLVLVLPSVLWAGNVFYQRAFAALRHGRLHMDLPISIGIVVGFGWGAANTIRNTGDVYFDSVATLIFLLLVGRFLQHRQQRRAAQATEMLYNLAPSTARRADGREVPVEALRIDDRIEVRAGETVPADGIVESGVCDLDRSILTGESRPVVAGPGEEVHAGTVNLSAAMILRVTSTGAETRIGQLMKQVEDLGRRKAPIEKIADRIAGVFVGVVLAVAVVTGIAWFAIRPERAIEHAVALLIVSCPCALGLATPLALSAALGRAAKRGILIKGGETLEALSRPRTLFLDKTGTLTFGRMELVEWIGDTSVQPLVAAIEAQSSHPIARALCRALPPPVSKPTRVVQKTGVGIEGEVDGEIITIGSSKTSLTSRALTPVAISRNGRVVAIAGLGDTLRPDAREVLDELRSQGWKVGILSGDHPDAVAEVARRLGLDPRDCHGGQSPEDKLRKVREGAVAMVGDGVNDAAALSAATVGIAVHGGAEASLAAADIFFTRPGLSTLAELFRGATRTMRVIRRGLAISLLYNVLGVSLAAFGLITPVLAAILMPVSSLSVVWSSYHSRTFS